MIVQNTVVLMGLVMMTQQMLFVEMVYVEEVKVTLTTGRIIGSATGENKATLNAVDESLVLLGISSSKFLVILNHGSVSLTSV